MAEVILVDIFDNEIGVAEKIKVHKDKLLHRAFSLFIINGNKMLLQQRALTKYHSPGKWANACCSHPIPSMDIIDCVVKRTKEELGIVIAKPKKLFDFIYFSAYDNGLCEYELDNVFLLQGDYTEFNIDKDEVNDIKWVDIDELAESLIKEPEKYCTWFLNCAPRVINIIKNKKCS